MHDGKRRGHAEFHTPTAARADPEDAPVNALGFRRTMFAVDDIDPVLDRLRSPEGIILALAEELA